jgi:hypothetical protein
MAEKRGNGGGAGAGAGAGAAASARASSTVSSNALSILPSIPDVKSKNIFNKELLDSKYHSEFDIHFNLYNSYISTHKKRNVIFNNWKEEMKGKESEASYQKEYDRVNADQERLRKKIIDYKINFHNLFKKQYNDRYKLFKNSIDNNNDIFPYNINITTEQDEILKRADGIFSFSFYSTKENAIDNSLVREKNVHIQIGDPLIFTYGILTYLRLIKLDEWKNWKVTIFTDKNSYENNPITFKLFEDAGGIVIIVDVPEEYKLYFSVFPVMDSLLEEPNNQNYIHSIRLCRFYPMFFYDCPVFVRDADTLFVDIIIKNINIHNSDFDLEWPYRSDKSLPLYEPDSKFVIDIGVWENSYKLQCNKKPKDIYLAYDFNYYFELSQGETNIYQKNFNDLENFKLIYSSPKNKFNDSQLVRFLAGCASSFKKLPLNIWTNFKKLLKNTGGLIIQSLDEYFLIFNIYSWGKITKNIGFFFSNYTVHTEKLDLMYDSYKELLNASAHEHRLSNDFVKNYLITFQSQSYNYVHKNYEMFPYYVRKNIKTRQGIQLFFLLSPSIQINDHTFYSPLEEEISLFKKQFNRNFPNFSFGRRMKSRKSKISKSRKTKKHYR